jgi:DNA end-binding protein Ku
MPAIKTAILFGRYSVPVSLSRATVDTDLQLHEYHSKDMSRTGRRTVCSGCGAELTAEDIVKGFEYGEQRVVLLTKDDIRGLKTDSENCIDILFSVSPDQIPPLYLSASYLASPGSGGEKDFEALRLALLEEKKILVGRSISGGLDSYAAVIPQEDGLLVSKLYLENEISRPGKPYKKPAVPQSELVPLKNLLGEIYSPFDLSAYENGYQNKLRDLIASKIAGGKDTYGIGQPVPADVVDAKRGAL